MYQPKRLASKLTAFTLCLFFYACHFFGGQVQINEKSTVQIEGTGVSQKEAQRLGQYLLEQGYFNNFDERTVYLRKKDKRFEVTFIINNVLFTSDKENLLPGFKVWHQWISDAVFPTASIRLVLADEQRRTLYVIDK